MVRTRFDYYGIGIKIDVTPVNALHAGRNASCMADKKHLAILKKGALVWNKWRAINPETLPNLGLAKLTATNLSGLDLQGADLSGANLVVTNLRRANLRGANLRAADLTAADLSGADLADSTMGVTV